MIGEQEFEKFTEFCERLDAFRECACTFLEPGDLWTLNDLISDFTTYLQGFGEVEIGRYAVYVAFNQEDYIGIWRKK